MGKQLGHIHLGHTGGNWFVSEQDADDPQLFMVLAQVPDIWPYAEARARRVYAALILAAASESQRVGA